MLCRRPLPREGRPYLFRKTLRRLPRSTGFRTQKHGPSRPLTALRGLADTPRSVRRSVKTHPSTGLYTSPQHIEGFQGRVFRTLGTVNRKNIEEYFPQRRASVVTRNYPAAAASLAGDFRPKDSERMFLIAFRDDRTVLTFVAPRVDLPSGGKLD